VTWRPTISEVCMVIITVFITLAYFRGWG